MIYTPYYSTDLVDLYLGDNVDVMEYFYNETIDLCVTSPPYFVNKKHCDLTEIFDEYRTGLYNMYQEVERLLKPGCYFVINFGDYHNSKGRMYDAEVPGRYPASVTHWEFGHELGLDLQSIRVWRKQFAKIAIPIYLNRRPLNVFDYEYIWTWRKRDGDGTEYVNDRKLSQRGVLGEDWRSSAGTKTHGAAFPVELPTWAIKVYSRGKDNVILDPYIGSGTTAIAAIRTGNYCVGIDIDKEYVDISKARIEEEIGQ
jgi:DNA modification methylase